MARAITAPELVKLRSAHACKLHAAIINMPVIFAARINQAFTSLDSVTQITFDTVTTGAYTDLVPGQTLRIGTAAGLSDIGEARIRAAATATVIYINETSELALANDLYLSVSNEFGLWQKNLRVLQTGVVYADWDITYSDQHALWLPFPNMGPHAVAELSGATVAVAWDASASWVPDSTISAYLWTAPGASATSGLTTATPTITYNAAGTYLVTLTVTAANGKSATGYRYTYVYAPDTAPACLLNACEGDQQTGGWEFEITMYTGAGLTDVPSRALVILFADDFYAGVKGSIGPIAGRENIIAYGWVSGESIERDRKKGKVTFTVSGPHYWLGQEQSFPASIENTSAAAATWYQCLNLTIDKGLASFLTWRATAGAVMDIYPSGDTKIAPDLIVPLGTLWEQIQTMAAKSILANIACDRYARLYAEIEPQLVPVGSRTWPSVMTITKNDTYSRIDVERASHPSIGRVELSGVNAPSGAFFSLAPGHPYKRHGEPLIVDRLLVADQATANTLAGALLGWKNNLYPRIEIPLAQNNRMIDIAPRQSVLLPIVSADTFRAITFTGNVIPRNVRLEYKSHALLTTVTGEAETFPDLSIDGDIPSDDSTTYPPFVIPPWPPLPPLPPLPPIVVPPIPVATRNILVILVPGYGIFFTSTVGAAYTWYSGNTPFTAAQRAAINRLEVSRTGTAYVTTSTNLGEVFSTLLGSNVRQDIGTKAFLDTILPNSGYPYYVDRRIAGLGIDYSQDDSIAVIISRPYPAYATKALMLTAGTLALRATPPLAIEYGGSLTNYAGNWFFTGTEGVLYATYVRRFSGDFTTLENTLAIDGPYMLINFHARAADYLYGLSNGTLFRIITKGSVIDQSYAGAAVGGFDCDPTGQYIMRINTAVNLSSDYGATWVAITTIPGTSIANGSVLNMGTSLDWVIVYNDFNALPLNSVNIWRTIDGGATWIDCLGNLISLGVPLSGVVGAIRYA